MAKFSKYTQIFCAMDFFMNEETGYWREAHQQMSAVHEWVEERQD